MIIWKIIPNTNNRYKISNYGKIININKNTEIKPYNQKKKLKVNLLVDMNKRKGYYIHILVYKLFVGSIKKNQYVYHIDENIYNNYIENLKLINRNQNKKYIEPNKINNKEIWKDITGYENRYKISSEGRVYSLVTNKILILQRDNSSFYVIR